MRKFMSVIAGYKVTINKPKNLADISILYCGYLCWDLR